MSSSGKGGESPARGRALDAAAKGAPVEWLNANQGGARQEAKLNGREEGAAESADDNRRRAPSAPATTKSRPINYFDSSTSLKFYAPSASTRKKKEQAEGSVWPDGEPRAQETSQKHSGDTQGREESDEQRAFLQRHQPAGGSVVQAQLAKQESLLSEPGEGPDRRGARREGCAWLSALTCCSCRCSCLPCSDDEHSEEHRSQREKREEEGRKMSRRRWLRRLCLWPLLLILTYSIAIYCLPFVDVSPRVPQAAPHIPFDFTEGPLRPSTASQFKVDHLFRGQIHGAESSAFDSHGNAYLAIEGGFILYAHLNKSSPLRTQYLGAPQSGNVHLIYPDLIKIAELNGVRQLSRQQQNLVRGQRSEPKSTAANFHYQEPSSSWRRECTLDEQLYGSQLYSPTSSELMAAHRAEGSPWAAQQSRTVDLSRNYAFVSRVKVSRCSKPLGVRLSPDESFLYVVDTLSGLYKVHLRQTERVYSSQRLVTRLIDFRTNNWHHQVPLVQIDPMGPEEQAQSSPLQTTRLVNISLKAVDDLTIDYGAGARNNDLIYFTVASQQWPAVSFVYDYLEGRPSGLVARFDTGNNQLVALDPAQVAHVRTSGHGLAIDLGLDGADQRAWANRSETNQDPASSSELGALNYGVPRMDENDVFDDRPLHFPNGIQLTDDRQALLIADTSNKRIIKHYIRGARRGTTDLWAYTPMYPDNIRRGYDKRHETYWVVGCGKAQRRSSAPERDAFVMLRTWPMVKKFAMKNVYFIGWFIEMLGQHLLMSENIRDYGYELRLGSSMCRDGCAGMMILQLNQNGDVIRSIHSPEFPNDLKYYSQVNELIDAQNQEHSLYLSSPSYNYISKLSLPVESDPATVSQPFSSLL